MIDSIIVIYLVHYIRSNALTKTFFTRLTVSHNSYNRNTFITCKCSLLTFSNSNVHATDEIRGLCLISVSLIRTLSANQIMDGTI